MNSMPMIVRCTLGQGGGPAYLDELAAAAYHADRVFGRDSAMARERRPITVEPEATHSTLAAWALNLSAVKELAEPTRGEL